MLNSTDRLMRYLRGKMKPLVIYHGKCTDGFTAAWVIARALEDVELFEGFYGAEPPDVSGRDVILVDFSYKRPVLEKMRESARSILILDHHKTSAEDLAEFTDVSEYNPPQTWQKHLDTSEYDVSAGIRNIYCLFDMNRSGARLAWDFFAKPGTAGEWLVNYVQDRDLWQWKLPDSRLVSAGLEVAPKTLASWDNLALLTPTIVADDGEIIERYRDICIESAVSLARPMTIGGYSVPCANSSEMRFASDTAHVLAEGHPFAATYWIRADGVVQFSLRSREDGLDVSEIAKSYGGGGHAHAAGFQVPISFLA